MKNAALKLMAIVIFITIGLTGCTLTQEEKIALQEEAIRDGAFAVVFFGLENKPNEKIYLSIAARGALELLEDKQNTLTGADFELLAATLDRPEFRDVAADLLELLYGYLKKEDIAESKKLTVAQKKLLAAFFKGILDGCECVD